MKYKNCLFLYFIFLQDSEKYVEQLLTLFNRFSKLVKEAFQDDPRFLTARDKVSLSFLKFYLKKKCYEANSTLHSTLQIMMIVFLF